MFGELITHKGCFVIWVTKPIKARDSGKILGKSPCGFLSGPESFTNKIDRAKHFTDAGHAINGARECGVAITSWSLGR